MTEKHDVEMQNDLPFAEFIDPYAISEIVSSRTYRSGDWQSAAQLRDFNNGIRKIALPIDISQYRILVVSEVSANRHIKPHKHDDEPQFRYITSGSLTLNGETYRAGEWVIVPAGVEYEIHTEEGYTTLAAYGMSCQCSQVGGH